jgi:hypothetical protein
MTEKTVTLTLTRAQALVLFEWLSLTDSAEAFSFEDSAEQQVVWAIEAQLESTLVEPLAENYKSLLDQARKEVRAGTEE